MKRWALIVAGLYCLILASLTVPVIMLAFAHQKDQNLKEAFDVYKEWIYWVWLGVMVLGQVALLSVPVRIASRRPVSRRSLWPTVLASGLMMGLLVFGAICTLYELVFTVEKDPGARGGWSMVGVAVVAWCIWSLIFMRLGRTQSPEDFVSRQCRALLKGSILELLIAIPSHIVARHRDQCCAGMMTFVGLVTGLSVMLFSFGPAVFFLFAERWKRLHPPGPS
jgi:hypothetical protein